MERKQAELTKERQEDWIQTQDWVRDHLHLSLQLLAAQARDQRAHFPPQVAIIEELLMDSTHYASSIQTYWTLSQEQTHALKALQDYLLLQNSSAESAFWDEEALFTDPRWQHIRHLASMALASFHWPIKVPPPERPAQRYVPSHAPDDVPGDENDSTMHLPR